MMQAFLKGGSIPKPKVDKSVSSDDVEKSKKKLTPWVEKYRPKSVNDVAYQDEVVSVLKKSLQGADLPNLLFYGPPGTGKTSTILAVARDLFGDMFRERVLELNASDERGIDVIRDKVKKFAQLTASSTRTDGRPCPPFRIVILDEADSMTHAAQSALRRTMERETKTTRFCLICNYVTRIIEPITSRCAKFRFKPLVVKILAERLNDICEKESINLDEEAMDILLSSCDGDLRKAITYLQSVARLRASEKVTKADIFEVAGLIEDEVIESLLNACRSNSYEKLQVAVQDLIADGQSAGQVISQVHDKVVLSEQMSDKQKSAICERLAIVDKRLMDGADEYLQIMDLCTVIMQQVSQSN